MKIFDKVPEELILLKLDVEDKQSFFDKVAAILKSYGYVDDEFEVLSGLNEREEIMSTGIGQGMAVPHTDCGGAHHFIVVVATLKKPIEFQAIDGKPVDIIFTFLVPQNRFDLLSRLLAGLARILHNSDLLGKLRNAATEREVLSHLLVSESKLGKDEGGGH